MNSIQKLKSQYPNKYIVYVFHWNYECEFYPQPVHRSLAHRLIDLGAYAVVGHHPHMLGPIEIYKGRTIAYSLGNFSFSYSKFFDNKLAFPSFTFQQGLLELRPACEDLIHNIIFCPPNNVQYLSFRPVSSIPTDHVSYCTFSGFSDYEYCQFFRRNRRKSYFLPIYATNNMFFHWIFDIFVFIRQCFIDLIVKLRLKSLIRS